MSSHTNSFVASGNSPGLAQVRENIQRAFAVIHSNCACDAIELDDEVSDAGSAQIEQTAQCSLAERAALYFEAANRHVHFRHDHLNRAYVIVEPSETAEKLVSQALSALNL